MSQSKILVASALFLAACSSATVGQGDHPDTTEQPLWAQTGVQLWNQTIPICFAQSSLLANDHSREKGIIQNAIERTWLRAANISVSWNGSCPTTGDDQYVRINLGPHTTLCSGTSNLCNSAADCAGGQSCGYDGSSDGQTGPGTGMAGMLTAAGVPEDPQIANDPGIRIWIQDDGGSEPSRLEYVAVHEFGHLLGFAHEQDRADNPDHAACPGASQSGTLYGAYDPDSVMNYCADTAHGYLSEGDVMNVRSAYGYPNAYRTLSADVNGDGKADAIAINSDAIYVQLSDGTRFNWSGAWANFPFYGSRETLMADVNGDGRADAIAINNGGVFVLLSDGTKFNWSGQWSAPFYGSRKTIAADVNGDGKADLIAVNNGAVFVSLSDGTKFNWAGNWSGGALYGTRGTFVGDVNGDGKADIVTSSISGWRVALSTGAAFNLLPATGTYSANSRATAIADADGDGKADLVALNDWGIDVSLSTGSGFGAATSWTAAPFFGAHDSLLADVTGDRKVDAIAVNLSGLFVLPSNGSTFVWSGEWSGAFYSQPWPH